MDAHLLSQLNQSLEAARPQFGAGIAPQLRRPAAGAVDWQECLQPFRHFSASDVFDAPVYQKLCEQFSRILDTTAGVCEGRYRMRPTQGANDGLVLGMTEPLAGAFAPLFDEAWLRSLATLLDLDFLPRIEGALHSNPQGSRTGWIHTDCCSAWFDERDASPEQLMLPPRGRCSYFTGKPKVAGARPVEYIRAATMIFYLCNDGWEPGDGGETAIYSQDCETPDTQVKLIEPRNNSLFLFECSPHSYHRFITNPGRRRNSIILWLHATVEDAKARWGDGVHRRQHR